MGVFRMYATDKVRNSKQLIRKDAMKRVLAKRDVEINDLRAKLFRRACEVSDLKWRLKESEKNRKWAWGFFILSMLLSIAGLFIR